MTLSNTTRWWIAALGVAAALAGGCASQDSVPVVTSADDASVVEEEQVDAADATTGAVADDSAPRSIYFDPPAHEGFASERPEGSIAMGRANWSSGRVHAQILHDLVEELGYEVTPPSAGEFAPDLAYQAMATGQIDFWANSWYPGHLSWWEGELRSNGRPPGDALVRIETLMAPDAGMQGWLVAKSWAEANNVTTLDQINDDPDLWRQFDSDGNNKGEFFGCPEQWTCDNIMFAMSEFAGWDNLEQVQADYDEMFAEFLARAERGEPAIIYTWAPTPYLARARLGETTMWISILDDSVLDDSNPLQIDLGDVGAWCQRCHDTVGFKGLSPDICLQGPDGCQLGWDAADIEITANREWLADYPAIHELFRQVNFSADELSTMLLEVQRAGDDELAVEASAADWIAKNREIVDAWLAAASAVG